MPKEMIHNIATGEVTLRELTDEEVAALDAAEVERDKDLTNLRIERNGNLTASDWTQLPDSPLSGSKKTAWATYRQELRDFFDGKTKQSEFTKDSDDRIVWPTKPS